MPAGTTWYWSWLFAAQHVRAPLLGVYALLAEWRALMDPATDTGVAQIKLAWWQEEMRRLSAGSPLHPITRYLAQVPRRDDTHIACLGEAVQAALAQVAGAPLELGAELEAHAYALLGVPLFVACELSGSRNDPATVRAATAALAAGDYLTRAVYDYRRNARNGRVTFPVDELLAAEIGNEHLLMAEPPPRLRTYLDELRGRAAAYFAAAAQAIPAAERPPLRHLSVLASLGAKHLASREDRSSADFRLADLYNAWNAARRAAAAR